MKYFYCEDCDEIFEKDDDTVRYDCSICGNGTREIRTCYLCNEPTPNECICDKCIEKETTLERAIDCARVDDECWQPNQTVNSFFEFVFSKIQINDILKHEFVKFPKSRQDEYIKAFIKNDEEDYSDFQSYFKHLERIGEQYGKQRKFCKKRIKELINKDD